MADFSSCDVPEYTKRIRGRVNTGPVKEHRIGEQLLESRITNLSTDMSLVKKKTNKTKRPGQCSHMGREQ